MLTVSDTGPGHFLEVRKLLPLLTKGSPDHPSFHVVTFSLPGFGFSEAPQKKGFAGKQYAEVCDPIVILAEDFWLKYGTRQVANTLMNSLGYKEYGERDESLP